MRYQTNDRINDQYRVQEQFSGGMGIVYIAIDEVTKRKLAIKTIRDEYLAKADAVMRFEREARCWINLGEHDNIVRAISFQRGDFPMLFLEYVDGPTLSQLIKNEQRGLDYQQAIKTAIQICDGLRYAHTCPMPNRSIGVMHRDIKPQNILIDSAGVSKLTDFGLVRSQNDTRLTRVLGTPSYMSPEQEVDSFNVSPKTDVYSLGLVISEMLTGFRPHPGASIEQFRPDVDKELVRLVSACLDHSPESRPTSHQLLADLHSLRLRIQSDAEPCPNCAYLPNRQHLFCPICGVDRELLKTRQWRCSCGKPNQEEFAFCLGCGKKKTTIEICDTCGKTNPDEFQFCIWCGTKIAFDQE